MDQPTPDTQNTTPLQTPLSTTPMPTPLSTTPMPTPLSTTPLSTTPLSTTPMPTPLSITRVKPKRVVKKIRDTLKGVTNGDIRRLARQGGIKRMKKTVYDEMRGSLKEFLTSVVGNAVTYTNHARRTTVTVNDIAYALKHQGITLYR